MKTRGFVWPLLALVIGNANAEGLGTFSEWSPPVNLGPVVNSGINDATPALAPNGLSLYFRSERPGGYGESDIYVSQRMGLGAPWEEPRNLGPNINTPGFEGGPNFSPDGLRLYFITARTGACGGPGDRDVWVSTRDNATDDFGWGLPAHLGCRLNSEFNEGGPSIFEDPIAGETTLYFDSIRPTPFWGIYASRLRPDGLFGFASNEYELNSTYGDGKPSIRRDGLEIIWSSMRPGFGGRDLWVSTRETVYDAWSSPVNLGSVINTEWGESSPYISDDGTMLFFDSDRPGGYGPRDIYVATRQRL